MDIKQLIVSSERLVQDEITQKVGRREASLERIQERMEGENMIANIDTFYFRVLCKGDERNWVADGGEVESQGIFFNAAYIMACAHGDGCDLVLSQGVRYHLCDGNS